MHRPLLLAAVVLALLPQVATARPGWPAKGRCIVAHYSKPGPCIQLSPADARAIQKAVVSYLDTATLQRRPDWRQAKVMVQRPINEVAIGGYHVYGDVWDGFSGDVIQLNGVDKHELGAESGYKAIVGRTPAGWTVLHFDDWWELDPQVD